MRETSRFCYDARMLKPHLVSFRFLSAIASIPLLLSLGGGCGDDESSAGGGGGTGGTGTGGDGDGGGGGQAGTCSLDAELGEALDLPKDTWTWVDFPDSLCMNNTPTGIAVNPSSTSNKVVIFLMGGNACFNLASCAITANTNGYASDKWNADADGIRTSQAFDRSDPDNPLKDYSYVFVPYCTGDVHAGDRSDVTVANKTYQFHGRKNLIAYLKRLVPTFRDADQVVLAGVSAGGFGAALSYDLVASAFCETEDVVLIDDSGPPMGDEFLAPCLQKHMSDTWGLASTLPADCPDCNQTSGAFAEPYVKYLLGKYPDRTLGVISSEQDGTIRNFWGYGESNCSELGGLPPPYDGAKYTAGLEDLRDRIVGDAGRFGLFMVPGDEHVFLDNDPTSVNVNGVSLKDWLLQALNNDPAFGNVSEP